MFSLLFTLPATALTLAVLLAPFCLLQLALCKLFRHELLRRLPLILFGGGMLWSFWHLGGSDQYGILSALTVMIPCILGLIGSALGWAIWKRRYSLRPGEFLRKNEIPP